MKYVIKGLFFLFISAFLFYTINPLPAQDSDILSIERPQLENASVWIIPINGDIDPFMAAFVRREARRALNNNADYIIFQIDTFGGRVDSTLQITSFITSIRSARTVAWINTSETSMGVSWSAGAIIAFACTDIFMASGTSMGAAAPVIAGPEGAQAADEKSVAAIRSQITALAERNNHPVGLALAMVDIDVELWEVSVDGNTGAFTLSELERMEREVVNGRPAIERIAIISEPGKLLSLSSGEAIRYGLAGHANDESALFSLLGISANVTASNPSAADTIISILTSGSVQAVLILLGLVMLFMELSSPGFGIPGTIGVLCFLLVFGSGFLLGRVDSLEIILFLIGLGLLAVEIFIIPGFGFVGISGILVIGASLVFSMQDFVIPRFDWEWQLMGRNAMVVFLGIFLSVLGIAILALLSPRIKIFDRLMLKTRITGTAGGPDPGDEKTISAISIIDKDEENYAELVGKIGVADTILRPSGKMVINDRVYSVEADNEFIEAGRGVIVTRVRGNRIIVRRV